MKKKGVFGAFGTLLIMIVVIFVVSMIFGPKILKAAKALFYPAQIESGSNLELIENSFDSFVSYYEGCNSKSGLSSCACKINGMEYFDLGIFPEDYYIKLESSGTDVRIKLYKGDLIKMDRIVKNNNLARYKFSLGCKEDIRISAPNVSISSRIIFSIFCKTLLPKGKKLYTPAKIF